MIVCEETSLHIHCSSCSRWAQAAKTFSRGAAKVRRIWSVNSGVCFAVAMMCSPLLRFFRDSLPERRIAFLRKRGTARSTRRPFAWARLRGGNGERGHRFRGEAGRQIRGRGGASRRREGTGGKV